MLHLWGKFALRSGAGEAWTAQKDGDGDLDKTDTIGGNESSVCDDISPPGRQHLPARQKLYKTFLVYSQVSEPSSFSAPSDSDCLKKFM